MSEKKPSEMPLNTFSTKYSNAGGHFAKKKAN
jgi:hypothetical protein